MKKNDQNYKKYLLFFIFFVSIFISQFSYAQNTNLFNLEIPREEEIPKETKSIKYILPKNAENRIISSIKYVGNIRTSDDVIEENMDLIAGEKFKKSNLHSSMQNLKNLQVFIDINIQIIENPEDNKKLDIIVNVDEKWTLLPYFLFGSGGGISYFVIGLYDTNFIGRLYTVNFTYGCKNENCSTYLYFRNPSVLGSRFNLVNYIWREHNIYRTYDKNRVVAGAFSNQRDMWTTFTDVKINPSFFLGFGFLYFNNNITENGILPSDVGANKFYNYQLPPSTANLAFEGRLTLGKIDYDGMKVDGVHFLSILDTTGEVYDNQNDNYTSLNSTVQYYNSDINLGLVTIPLPKQSYLAVRANLSMTTSDVVSQQYFVGGLDKIRGFFDSEYYGKIAWFSNMELRIPSYVSENLAIQHALFTDAGYAANTFPDIFSHYTGVSIGTGVRILPLKINRVAIRFDYAYTLNPIHTFGFNFGLLQFF